MIKQVRPGAVSYYNQLGGFRGFTGAVLAEAPPAPVTAGGLFLVTPTGQQQVEGVLIAESALSQLRARGAVLPQVTGRITATQLQSVLSGAGEVFRPLTQEEIEIVELFMAGEL